MRSYIYISILFVMGMSLLFLDFYSKAYIYHLLPFTENAELTSYFVNKKMIIFENFLGIDFFLNLTMNKGAAWGLFSNFQMPLEIARIIVVFGLLVFLFFFSKDRKKDIPLLLVIVGAIGNIVDFFLYGSVVDFFHFNLWGYNFPVFNVADILITCGVALLFFQVSGKKKLSADGYAA